VARGARAMAGSSLFAPLDLGPTRLANRIVMAPMSRNRANADEAAHALTALYYRQRAGAGLIISEATPISPAARNAATSPGIDTARQIEGWRRVTEAIHEAGGKIFVQLAHSGKVAPSEPLPPHPGTADFIAPEALSLEAIAATVADFARAAANAKAAGFDGIELHAGNGYLIDRFLRDNSNRRDDAFGGTSDRRARLLFAVIDAVAVVWNRARVGVKLLPASAHNGASDSDPERHFGALASRLSDLGLAYLHAVETSDIAFDWPRFRAAYRGIYIANAGYDRDRAAAAIASGYADLVSFGVPYIANPDLVERFRANAPLNQPDKSTFFGGSAKGYTDYPTLAASKTFVTGRIM
jgi:N-ethylmaleimide reductase